MNLKQLLILLLLAAVVGGAGLALYRNQNASRRSGNAAIGKKLLGDFPFNSVTRITIQHDTNALNLVKQDDLWRVRERHDYPADFSRISSFLLKARDLKVIQSDPVGPSQLARFQLAPAGQGTNSALEVQFGGADGKTIQTLWLGKLHLKSSGKSSPFGGDDMGWPDGRYVKTAGSDAVAVVSDPLDGIEPKPGEWLNKDFIRIEKAKSIEAAFPVETNSWKLTRETETGEWELAGAKPDEPLDTMKVSGVASPLNSPSFADVMPGTEVGGQGTNAPAVVKVGTFDDFNYTLRIGAKTNENYPVVVAVTARIPGERVVGKDEKPEDKARLDKEFKDRQQKLEEKLKREQSCEKWTYLVQGWSLDPLLRERHQLFAEKKEEPKPEGDAAAETNSVSELQLEPVHSTNQP